MSEHCKAILDMLYAIRPEADFSGSSDFLRDGLLDSFDLVMLVSSLDETFGFSIAGVDIVPENFSSLERIARLISKYGAAS